MAVSDSIKVVSFDKTTGFAIIQRDGVMKSVAPPYDINSCAKDISINNADCSDIFCFDNIVNAQNYLAYLNAKSVTTMFYPMVSRLSGITEVTNYDQAKRLMRKELNHNLKNGAIDSKSVILVKFLRCLYGDSDFSLESIYSKNKWLRSREDQTAIAFKCNAKSDSYNFYSFMNIFLREIRDFWIPGGFYEDTLHWSVFYLSFSGISFSEKERESLVKIYSDSKYLYSSQDFKNRGGHLRQPWQKKVRSSR